MGGCNVKDWKTFANFNLCIIHNKKFGLGEKCPEFVNKPPNLLKNDENTEKCLHTNITNSNTNIHNMDNLRMNDFADPKKEVSSKVHNQLQVNTSKSQEEQIGLTSKRKYVRKNKYDIFERFHNYGVKFVASVDWSALFKFENVVLRNNVSYYRVDLDFVLVRVFRKSILLTLRSSADIKGLNVKDAESLAKGIIIDALAHLPKSIVVNVSDVVSLHNAFVNHVTAKLFKDFFGREMCVKDDAGKILLVTDNSHHLHELEYVDKDSAVDLSVDRELYEKDLLTKNNYKPSEVKEWIDAHSKMFTQVAETQKSSAEMQLVSAEKESFYAEQHASHVGAIRQLGDLVGKLDKRIGKLGKLTAKNTSKTQLRRLKVQKFISRYK